jgi:hypothetical protein
VSAFRVARAVRARAAKEPAAGEWRIYDRPGPELRRDITAEVLQSQIARGDETTTLPAGGRPMRGFVIPGLSHD